MNDTQRTWADNYTPEEHARVLARIARDVEEADELAARAERLMQVDGLRAVFALGLDPCNTLAAIGGAS